MSAFCAVFIGDTFFRDRLSDQVLCKGSIRQEQILNASSYNTDLVRPSLTYYVAVVRTARSLHHAEREHEAGFVASRFCGRDLPVYDLPLEETSSR